ncbi:MAG: hypothetical protein Tsb0032_34930 [Kiloniellaceae bacterium]
MGAREEAIGAEFAGDLPSMDPGVKPRDDSHMQAGRSGQVTCEVHFLRQAGAVIQQM